MAPIPLGEEQSPSCGNQEAYDCNGFSAHSLASGRFSDGNLPPPSKKSMQVARSDYKPTALRWWFHLGLIACLAASIGLTQYAVSSLGAPHAESSSLMSNLTKARNWENGPQEYSGIARAAKYGLHVMRQYFLQDEDTVQGSAPEKDFIQLGETTFNIPNLPRAKPTSNGLGDIELQSSEAQTLATDVRPLEQSNRFMDIGKHTLHFKRAEPTGNGLEGISPLDNHDQLIRPPALYLRPGKVSEHRRAEQTGNGMDGINPVYSDAAEALRPDRYLTLGKVTELRDRNMPSPASPTRTSFPGSQVEPTATRGGSEVMESASGFIDVGETTVHSKKRQTNVTPAPDMPSPSSSALIDVLHLSEHAQRRTKIKMRSNKTSPLIFDVPPPSVDSQLNAGLGRPYYIHIGKATFAEKRDQNLIPTTDIFPATANTAISASTTIEARDSTYSIAASASTASHRALELSIDSTDWISSGLSPSETNVFGSTGQFVSAPYGSVHVIKDSTSFLRTERSTAGGRPADVGIRSAQDQTTNIPSQAPDPSMTIMIVQETKTQPPTESTSQETTTESDGHRTVETIATTLPGRTSVLQLTLTLSQSQTMMAQPSVMATTVGGTTKTLKSTFTDSEGEHETTRTTIVGGTPTSRTLAVMVPTSITEGQQLVTLQEVVSTTLGDTTRITWTTSVNSQMRMTSSFYTTVVKGTPTLETLWTVIASSAPSAETLVTIPTVVPVTVEGTSKLTTKTYTDTQGDLKKSTFATALRGIPTSTILWTVIATPTPQASGISSPSSNTSTGTEPIAETNVLVLGITTQEYFLAAFLPTILAVLISFPIKLIGINARLMQPFHALATADEARGCPPQNSVFLQFYGWPGIFSFIRAFQLGQPIIAVTDMLVFGAGLLAPLAAETIAVYEAFDDCVYYCYGTLGVSLVPGRLLQALMSTLVALLLVLIVLLSVRHWKTGVCQNPWGIAGMASLCLDSEMRGVLRRLPRGLDTRVKESMILEILAEKRYGIGFQSVSSDFDSSYRNYGVSVASNATAELPVSERGRFTKSSAAPTCKKTSQPFLLLTWWGRGIMLFVFASIMAMLAYYENSYSESGFEMFMDSQSFGVKFFFTALGVILGYSMETVFRCE